MLVEQLYADNPLRNFHYLIACPETREALVIDPLDVDRCLHAAEKNGWKITQILNTHEHWDHIGGNEEMIEKTGAKVLAHHGAAAKIDHLDRGLSAGDIVEVGRSVKLKVLDTPGHTMSHVCLLSNSDQPGLFCGDTLFNAGAGNCKNGGHPNELYDTFSHQLATLPDATRIYPGHDYFVNNLQFTLDREPGNEAAKRYLSKLEGQDPHHAYVSSLGEEKTFNTFFRLDNPEVIERLREKFPDLSDTPTEKEVFIALRELRNSW
ncbi:hydroxyacylglutathione hydrolase [Emcibacter nanhaiensis]|uniref:Hydroxyacylglutathione hydrolase n=1 Tax=Emcibacter nanhaiensis TaxID=1505037 RepID=A0A501PCD3_9PROT|nr:hydroxyacylglutathione hydrolase [Emcibacter nanhaiensis]TPD57731.1 hydroxyacylglutathione hydrolase [Emcibacter nanhaiensis]